MRKIKLKNKGKVVLTIILLIISVIIYLNVGKLGDLAQTHLGYQLICLGAWFWLIVGQMVALACIWEG